MKLAARLTAIAVTAHVRVQLVSVTMVTRVKHARLKRTTAIRNRVRTEAHARTMLAHTPVNVTLASRGVSAKRKSSGVMRKVSHATATVSARTAMTAVGGGAPATSVSTANSANSKSVLMASTATTVAHAGNFI